MPFLTDDDVAAFVLDIVNGADQAEGHLWRLPHEEEATVRLGEPFRFSPPGATKPGARWSDLSAEGRNLARRIKKFWSDKSRVRIGAGPPHKIDRALILWVIRVIEETTGQRFRFSRPAPPPAGRC
jgi:hypothetical protein